MHTEDQKTGQTSSALHLGGQHERHGRRRGGLGGRLDGHGVLHQQRDLLQVQVGCHVIAVLACAIRLRNMPKWGTCDRSKYKAGKAFLSLYSMPSNLCRVPLTA